MTTAQRLEALGNKLFEMQEQLRHDEKLACQNVFAQGELLRATFFLEMAAISALIASNHEELGDVHAGNEKTLNGRRASATGGS